MRVAMPLDTGATDQLNAMPPGAPAPTLQSGEHVGQALKAVREAHKLSLEEVAEATRIRKSYLAAIEDLRLDLLPSRPFTIGYIRAYAQALGLDGDGAVERFKADDPAPDQQLRNPIGVEDKRDPKLTAIIVSVVVVIAAIVAWNIAQRAMTASAPPPPTASADASAKALATTKAGPVALGAPLPAPVESTTPTPYETPGLARASEDGKADLTKPKPTADDTPAAPLAATFVAEGPVLGATAAQPSVVTLKALRSAALIIHGADGAVHFARQLDKGEAYRIPQTPGLTIDVSDAQAFQVFAAGQSRGYLPAAQTAASKLAGEPTKAAPVPTQAPAASR
jgi:cytoskeleton protein RodZ